MVIRRALFLTLCLIMAAPMVTNARDLTVYCEYAQPTTETKGDRVGLIYAQVLKLMHLTKTPGRVKTVSWKRGYEEALGKPDIALFPTTRTPEREDLFHWIGPILSIQWVFFSHADSKLVINSLDDARRVGSIGTYTNDSKEEWLKAHGFTNLVSVMDNQTNIRKLYQGRIDLMVETPDVIYQWPKRYGLDPSKLVMAYPFKTVDLYLALSKDTAPDTVRAYQKAFDEMIQDGTLLELYEELTPDLRPPSK